MLRDSLAPDSLRYGLRPRRRGCALDCQSLPISLEGLFTKIARLPQAVKLVSNLRVQRNGTGSRGWDNDAIQRRDGKKELRIANGPRPGVLNDRSDNPSKGEQGPSELARLERGGKAAVGIAGSYLDTSILHELLNLPDLPDDGCPIEVQPVFLFQLVALFLTLLRIRRVLDVDPLHEAEPPKTQWVVAEVPVSRVEDVVLPSIREHGHELRTARLGENVGDEVVGDLAGVLTGLIVREATLIELGEHRVVDDVALVAIAAGDLVDFDVTVGLERRSSTVVDSVQRVNELRRVKVVRRTIERV